MTVKTRGAELVRDGLEDLTKEVPLISRKRIYESMLGVRKILSTPAPKPTYPLRWASERQRRYVIAMLKAQGNLPYRRTNQMPRGWVIERTETGYRIYNTNDAAVHVYGNYEGARQQPMHEGRHPVMQRVVEEAIQKLPSEIEGDITYYGRSKGL